MQIKKYTIPAVFIRGFEQKKKESKLALKKVELR